MNTMISNVAVIAMIMVAGYTSTVVQQPSTPNKPIAVVLDIAAPIAVVTPQAPDGRTIETRNFNEYILASTAQAHNITGRELAAFMAQCAHETRNFEDLTERTWGNPKHFESYEPTTRLGKLLGNTVAGDGARYRGRGFIQLTGRWNYTWAARHTQYDLVNNPELAADPVVAAEIAVEFWKQRVQSRVEDFSDVSAVTRPINPKLHGLNERQEYFENYDAKINAS